MLKTTSTGLDLSVSMHIAVEKFEERKLLLKEIGSLNQL